MSSILLILTQKYPYANGESFLANELEYIPDRFDEIVIYPMLICKQDDCLEWKYRKPLDQRISVIRGTEFYRKRNILRHALRSVFSKDFWRELNRLGKEKRLTAGNLKLLLLYMMRCRYGERVVCRNVFRRLSPADTVSVYSYWMDYDAYTACLLKRKYSQSITSCITRCHRGDLYEEAARGGYLPMRRVILTETDRICSISDDGLCYLRRRYPAWIRDNLSVSRLGTPDYGMAVPADRDSLRVVSCSWVRKVKRVQLIAGALKAVNFRVSWTHYGSGPEMDALEEAVRSINNPAVECCLRGECRNEEVLREYRQHGYQVFINVSEHEGVPVSIMEAMSFGMIVIATDVGGTRELIEEGRNGYLLEKDAAGEQLAERLKQLSLKSREELAAMSARSREIWREKYAAQTNYPAFYEYL